MSRPPAAAPSQLVRVRGSIARHPGRLSDRRAASCVLEAPISFRSALAHLVTPRDGGADAADAGVRWFRVDPRSAAAADTVFVLMHGVGLSHRSFSRLARQLAAHGTVLAPDLPGHGATPGPGRRLGIDEMVELLLPRVDAAAEARPAAAPLVVLGHSLGVEVAVEIARRRPHLVRALVLVGPVVDPAAASAVGQARRLTADMWGEPPLTGAMVTRDYVRAGLFSYAAGVRSMLRYDTAGRLGDVQVPTLVLRGAHDPIAPLGWVRRLSTIAPRGRVVEVPGAVHNVVHSHADEVGRHVVAFATETARRGR
jgi:pimeloyl-ACP methyl ester carboxylesterase